MQSKKFADLNLTGRELKLLNQSWRAVMTFLSVGLIFLFCGLYYLIFYSFIYDTCFWYHAVFRNYLLTAIILLVGIWLGIYMMNKGFNLMFNFVHAILVSPGYTEEIFKKIQSNDPENATSASPFIYDPSKFEYNKTMIYVKLRTENLNYCQKCRLPKPQRAHHCSTCNKCVLKMDHHCPWINNCVGYQNHRHFALFLFYVVTSTGYVTLLNIGPLMNGHLFTRF